MQMPDRALTVVKRRLKVRRRGLEVGGFVVVAALVAFSAVRMKEGRFAPPLAAVSIDADEGQTLLLPAPAATLPHVLDQVAGLEMTPGREELSPSLPEPQTKASGTFSPGTSSPETSSPRDSQVRWFNGRPVKPVRTITMTVTAYSPDARSCGDSADGKTATLHDVTTNASRLVAADPSILKYGSLLSIPGYDDGMIVPVLDCGGKIRGHRLDVLYPTHEQAKRWGVRKLQVVVWGYADGKPADDPRKLR